MKEETSKDGKEGDDREGDEMRKQEVQMEETGLWTQVLVGQQASGSVCCGRVIVQRKNIEWLIKTATQERLDPDEARLNSPRSSQVFTSSVNDDFNLSGLGQVIALFASFFFVKAWNDVSPSRTSSRSDFDASFLKA